MTYGRWKIHGPVVNTNLQRRWENTGLASSLPITLTDGAVMGPNWRMHISSNRISCFKGASEKSGSSCGNNDITPRARSSGDPAHDQASRTPVFLAKIPSHDISKNVFSSLLCCVFEYQIQWQDRTSFFFVPFLFLSNADASHLDRQKHPREHAIRNQRQLQRAYKRWNTCAALQK